MIDTFLFLRILNPIVFEVEQRRFDPLLFYRSICWESFLLYVFLRLGSSSEFTYRIYSPTHDLAVRWSATTQAFRSKNTIGLKNGMFSHGYHISDTQHRLEQWHRFVSEVSVRDKTFFSRGEQDAEWQVCGWSSRNTQQALYWSALFATHCGLDMWNLPQDTRQG
jgi:hypothetical protein